MTKWVYPPLVWRILRVLTTRRVKPNTVTFVGIAACFGAVPFFATGLWVPGLVLAYVMSVLDSVDGKLARLTYQSSAQGDVLDHGMDLVHPPFWYWAWGWALSGGNVSSPVFQASMWMVVFYIFDRVMEMLFTAGTGKSIHGYAPLDMRLRTVISRRNVNLAIFTVALAAGFAVPAFYAIVAWQAASALFHLSRVIKFWNDGLARHLESGDAAVEGAEGMPPGDVARHDRVRLGKRDEREQEVRRQQREVRCHDEHAIGGSDFECAHDTAQRTTGTVDVRHPPPERILGRIAADEHDLLEEVGEEARRAGRRRNPGEHQRRLVPAHAARRPSDEERRGHVGDATADGGAAPSSAYPSARPSRRCRRRRHDPSPRSSRESRRRPSRRSRK